MNPDEEVSVSSESELPNIFIRSSIPPSAVLSVFVDEEHWVEQLAHCLSHPLEPPAEDAPEEPPDEELSDEAAVEPEADAASVELDAVSVLKLNAVPSVEVDFVVELFWSRLAYEA